MNRRRRRPKFSRPRPASRTSPSPTLKLSRALHEKGGFSQEAADATASALNEALGADVATKSDIKLLNWMVGANFALTLAVFVKLFIH